MVRELSLLLMVLLLGCCGSDEGSSVTPGAGSAPKAPAASRATANTTARQQRLGKQRPSENFDELAPEKGFPSDPDHWPPGFELPLDIHVDAPEPPPEIVGPSPPIKELKKPAEKKATEPKADEKKSDQKQPNPKQPAEPL
jgi:hypothetical protein